MAILYLRDEQRTLTNPDDIAIRLREIGVHYERWAADRPLADDVTAEAVLAAYAGPVAELKQQGGYLTADVIDISPNTPNLDAMLAKFSREHWHDEDEVRFIVAGRGIFHLHPLGGAVVAVEVVPGDLLRVPRGTHHWFDLCSERRIRAIRLFQQMSGWAPQYTDTGVDAKYQPLCLA
ncbi:MAG TPA: cupin domain-containing protein [Kofleriaceae bacterium]|jgi:1,2-dihydroxy-3-keto-5-methylthiopentene dioxygenase|nr:cupin domain-containing protein [Kofleriaceae bacterium]